jgi:hypothetical protein
MPRVWAASSSSAAAERSRKDVFNSRSSGGYPDRASSGNTTSAAPCSRASPVRAAILAALPSMSPTVGLI